jgi:predicted glycosyltransferase
MSGPRIALYGHDSLGLGHVRRNLAIAGSLSALADRPDVLLATGAAEIGAFALPPRTEVLRVPSVRKGDDGAYRSGRWSVDLDAVISVRRAVLQAGLEAFGPDLLVVDKVALGLGEELEPALRRLRRRFGTRLVLGLRDVLDDQATVRREWATTGTAAVLRELFDEVWVYGDPKVHDLIGVCGADELRSMTRYTGYLSAGRDGPPLRPPMVPAGRPYVLCTVGGGADGGAVACSFARAPLPTGVVGLLMVGSQMPLRDRRELDRLVHGRRDLATVPLCPDLPRWIPGARAVVSMGGYNSISEILATSTPALVVPRRTPRREQDIRARALATFGALDALDPTLADPEVIGDWLHSAVHRRPVDRTPLDLGGLERVRSFASDLIPWEAHHAAV